MGQIDEYIDKVEEYRRVTNQLIATKDKEIDHLEEIVLKSDRYIKVLKEMLCRSIEGELSEETQKKILAKFRN